MGSRPTVTEHGDIYLGLDRNYRSPNESRTFAHFAPDGTRLGDVIWPNEKCQIQPGLVASWRKLWTRST